MKPQPYLRRLAKIRCRQADTARWTARRLRKHAVRLHVRAVCVRLTIAATEAALLRSGTRWTPPRNWTSGQLVTAAQFNAAVRDNACAPAGVR